MFLDSFDVFLGYPINHNNHKKDRSKNVYKFFEYQAMSQNISSTIYFRKSEVTKKIKNSKLIPKNMFLQINDILIKTTPPHQAILVEEIDDYILVPSTFIIIRANSSELPISIIHLWAIINSSVFKHEIRRMSQITFGRSFLLNMRNIKEIKIAEEDILRIKQISNLVYKTELLKNKYKHLMSLNDKRIKSFERKKI